MVILLLYMAGGGEGGVYLTLNVKMYIMCAILFLPPPWSTIAPMVGIFYYLGQYQGEGRKNAAQ